MLTKLKTDFLLTNILENKNKVVDKIYYDDLKNERKEVKTNQCQYCMRQFGRKDTYKIHLMTCRAKIEQLLALYQDHPSHFRSYRLDRNGNQTMELSLPLPNKERLVMFICGQNGCGKSFFIRQLLLNYLTVYPERDIYLFSSQEYDDKLDSLPNIKRIAIDESFLIDELTLNDLRNSICIFDDVDCIRDKKLQRAVDGLKFEILKNGRDHTGDRTQDIDIIITNHMTLGGHETKFMIYESFYYVLFPQGTTAHSIETICKKYAGLDREQTQKVLKNDSRAVIIHKNYPRYVLTDKEIFLV